MWAISDNIIIARSFFCLSLFFEVALAPIAASIWSEGWLAYFNIKKVLRDKLEGLNLFCLNSDGYVNA